MIRTLTEHPRSVGETYAEHAAVASRFGWQLIKAGMKCLIHALLPCLFTTAGSDAVATLHAVMSARSKTARDHEAVQYAK